MKVAIVGAGLMGHWHARYAAAEGAQITAVVDAQPERASALARRSPSARPFASLTESLGATAFDAVHICADSDRVALTEEALEAGRHVLVEKPAATSGAEARRLLDVAGRQGVRLCPVHQFGFQRGFRDVLARRERLGTLVRLEGTVFSVGGEDRSVGERQQILLGVVPHFVSLFHTLAGPLSALDWRALAFTADDLELWARKAEVTLSLTVSLRARPRRNELRVVGTEAAAHVDLYHGFATFEAGAPTRTGKALAPFRHAAAVLVAATTNLAHRTLRGEAAFPGLRALIAAFYRSAGGHGDPPISAEELIESARLIERTLHG